MACRTTDVWTMWSTFAVLMTDSAYRIEKEWKKKTRRNKSPILREITRFFFFNDHVILIRILNVARTILVHDDATYMRRWLLQACVLHSVCIICNTMNCHADCVYFIIKLHTFILDMCAVPHANENIALRFIFSSFKRQLNDQY